MTNSEGINHPFTSLSDIFSTLQIKNQRLIEWIRKALKESYKDQALYNASSITEWETQLKQAQKRLDNLYDDKMDEKISEEMHTRKYNQYTEEKNKAIDMLAKHSNANNKFHQLGINLFDISQRGKEVYLKADIEKKRILLSLVFSNMNLENGILSYEYTKAFAILAKAIQDTKSSKMLIQHAKQKNIFEPLDKVENSIQRDHFEYLRPIMLPQPWINLTFDFTSIIHAFQDLRYIGELRERWNEIKKLQMGHSVTFAV